MASRDRKTKPTVPLSNDVECDEASVIASPKGQPDVGKPKGRKGRRRPLERPPVLGMMPRCGQGVITWLAKVQPKTSEPYFQDTLVPGTLVHTDEYSMDARRPDGGYDHKSVTHGRGEDARDAEGDGWCVVPVHTMAGGWALLGSWLRPHRGISQENLPLYSASSRWCTPSASEAKRYCMRSLRCCSHTTLESNMSVVGLLNIFIIYATATVLLLRS